MAKSETLPDNRSNWRDYFPSLIRYVQSGYSGLTASDSIVVVESSMSAENEARFSAEVIRRQLFGEAVVLPNVYPLISSKPTQILSQQNKTEHFELLPNPFHDNFTLKYTNLSGEAIEVVDISGRLIKFITLTDEDEEGVNIDLNGFENGMYILKVLGEDKSILYTSVVVKN